MVTQVDNAVRQACMMLGAALMTEVGRLCSNIIKPWSDLSWCVPVVMVTKLKERCDSSGQNAEEIHQDAARDGIVQLRGETGETGSIFPGAEEVKRGID